MAIKKMEVRLPKQQVNQNSKSYEIFRDAVS